MRCPTLDELTSAILALLPRGRAWQTHESEPMPGYEVAFNPSAFANEAFATTSKAPSILWQYWRAVALVIEFLTKRSCALREEFWCASMSETRAGWLYEYGLPDACDPFPDLCSKVAAIGGTRCEYYAEIAARAGWLIDCLDRSDSCGSRAGCATAGRATVGSPMSSAMLRIIVYASSSPAYVSPRFRPPKAGRMKAGQFASCPGDPLLPLQCLLSRVIHAEIKTVYEARLA